MQVGSEQAPELILVAMAKEADWFWFLWIRRIDPFELGHVEPVIVAIDKRSRQSTLVEDPDTLRWRKDEFGVARVETVRGQERADQNGQVHRQQDGARNHSDTMATKLPPHHPPLRGHKEALLPRCHPLDRIRVEGRAGDVMREQAAGVL